MKNNYVVYARSIALLLVELVVLQACIFPDWRTDGKLTRYLSLRRDQFDQKEVEVPSGEPFRLAIDATDDTSSRMWVSSKDLNLKPVMIRTHAHGFSPVEMHMPERTYMTLGPLSPGRYVLICDCHRGPAQVALVAKPLVSKNSD